MLYLIVYHSIIFPFLVHSFQMMRNISLISMFSIFFLCFFLFLFCLTLAHILHFYKKKTDSQNWRTSNQEKKNWKIFLSTKIWKKENRRTNNDCKQWNFIYYKHFCSNNYFYNNRTFHSCEGCSTASLRRFKKKYNPSFFSNVCHKECPTFYGTISIWEESSQTKEKKDSFPLLQASCTTW